MKYKAVGVLLASMLATTLCYASISSASVQNTKKTTVNVMVMGQIAPPAPPTGAYPNMVIGAQVAANALNKTNANYKINVLTCNDNSNPNQAQECADQAVSDHVAAVVGLWTLYSTTVYPILAQAHIPVLSSVMLGANESTSSAAFPWFSGLPGEYIALAQAVVKAGCTHVATLSYSLTVGSLAPEYVNEVLAADHLAPAIQISAGSGGLPDYAPAVQSAISQGAGCIIDGLAASQTVKLVLANAVVSKPLLIAAFGNSLQETLPQLGRVSAAGDIGIFPSPPVGVSGNATNRLFEHEMSVYHELSADQNNGFVGWIGTQIFGQALAKIKAGHSSVTGAMATRALTGLHVVLPGFLNYTYRFAGGSGAFSHIANFNIEEYHVVAGNKLAFVANVDTKKIALGG